MPKLTPNMPVSKIRKLEKTEGLHAIGYVPGFCLRVRKRSSDSRLVSDWVLRRQGKQKFFFTIGSAADISLNDAITIAKTIETNINKEKLSFRLNKIISTRETGKKVSTLIEEWLNFKDEIDYWKNKNQLKIVHKRMKFYANHILDLPITKVSNDDIIKIFTSLKNKLGIFKQFYSNLKQFFAWCMSKSYLKESENPFNNSYIHSLFVGSLYSSSKPHPSLDEKLLPTFCKLLLSINSPVAICLLFSILTCSRSLNARFLRVSELSQDLSFWTIPATQMKVSRNGQQVIPLSKQAKLLLKNRLSFLNCEYLFSSLNKPISHSAMNALIKRLDNQAVSKGELGWIDVDQTHEYGRRIVAVQHGIARASFTTWALNQKYDKNVIELILHHDIDPHLRGAYNRVKLLSEKQKILQDWADFLLPDFLI